MDFQVNLIASFFPPPVSVKNLEAIISALGNHLLKIQYIALIKMILIFNL